MSGAAQGAPGVGPPVAPRSKGAVMTLLSRLVREKPLGAVGGVIVLAFLFVGTFAPLLAPHDLFQKDIRHNLEGPSRQYPLGTDQFGRDTLTRIIYGAQVSMFVGVGAGLLQLVIAASLGLISGYWGGKFDLVLQRFVDAIMTFPWLFLTLTIMSLLGPGVLQIILVLGFQWGIANVRTIRGVVLSTRENVYVEAARAVGCPTAKILVRHILPHMWAPIIVLFTVSLGANIIGEATVSFLGFGIAPPRPSWGTMLSVEGKKYMLKSPWLSLWPGLSLAVVVYGVNMLGDALRDLLDPRLRGGIGRIGAAN